MATEEETQAAAAAEAQANAARDAEAAATAKAASDKAIADAAAAQNNETPDQKIERLEASLKKANAEAGNARVNAKTAAAEEARTEYAQKIGLALGIIEPENVDPAKLTEQIAASTAQARQAQVELAVFRAAEAAGGDPIALLDSRAFLAKVAAIEPTDSVALAGAITEAVAENARLGKATPGAPVGPGLKPNPAQGSSAAAPVGLAAQIAAAEASGAPLKERMRLKALQATQQQ